MIIEKTLEKYRVRFSDGEEITFREVHIIELRAFVKLVEQIENNTQVGDYKIDLG